MNNRQKLGYVFLGVAVLVVIGLGLSLGCAKKITDGIIVTQGQRSVLPYNSYMQEVSGEWRGYLTASESLRWLKDNGCEVQESSDGIGYIITRDSYDSLDLYIEVMSTSGTRVGNVALTLDEKGDLRVKVFTPDE